LIARLDALRFQFHSIKNKIMAKSPLTDTTASSDVNKIVLGHSPSSLKKGKKKKTLEDLFEDNLKDIFSAEKQLLSALPEMGDAAESEELQDLFQDHLEESKRHVTRLEKIFSRLGIDKSSVEKCAAMEGLIKECRKTIAEFEENAARDSALIIGAQKIEHYEIAAYGSLCELADVLGLGKIKEILGLTLDEEEEADDLLSQIAEDVNDEAFEMSSRKRVARQN
jgi:ferritin-like metal-binding protein YciE